MKTKKRVLAYVTALCMMFMVLSGCSGNNTSSSNTQGDATEQSDAGTTSTEGETLKIAGLFNLSGSAGDTGIYCQNGCELAVKHINESGGIKSMGGIKLEMVYGDTMSDPSQAKAVAERVLADEDVVAISGFSSSAYGLPILPVIEKNEIPTLTIGTSTAFTNQGYTYIFQHVQNAEQLGETQVEFIKWLNEVQRAGIETLGALYEDSENGLNNLQGNKAAAEAAGLELTWEGPYQAGLTDASSLIAGLKASGVDAVFCFANPADSKVLFNTMESMDCNVLIIGGGGGMVLPTYSDELQDSCIGIVSACSNPYDTAGVLADDDLNWIAEDYEATYGHFMPEHAVGCYTNVMIIAKGLEAAGTADGPALRDAIRDLTDNTFSGELNFDDTGANLNARASMVQWFEDEDGQYRTHAIFPEDKASVEYVAP